MEFRLYGKDGKILVKVQKVTGMIYLFRSFPFNKKYSIVHF